MYGVQFSVLSVKPSRNRLNRVMDTESYMSNAVNSVAKCQHTICGFRHGVQKQEKTQNIEFVRIGGGH